MEQFEKEKNRVNNMLLSSQPPDRTALKREAEEFIEYIKTLEQDDQDGNEDIHDKR